MPQSFVACRSDRSDRDPSDNTVINDIFTTRPDATNVRKVTDSAGFNGDAAYAPDGDQIAFDAGRGDYLAAQGT